MKIHAHTIEAYFEAVSGHEEDLRALDLIIRKATNFTTELFESSSLTMLAYGLYHYKYASGKEGDWPVIALASQKNHISLYICAIKDGQYLPEVYGKRLGKVSVGKSCIRFKDIASLNEAELVRMLREAAEWCEAHKGTTVSS